MAYDVKMIKDFIDHLRWSIQVDHFESRAGPDAFNPELAEQVQRYGLKHDVPRLLSLFSLAKDKPELTDQQMREAVRRFANRMADRRAEQLQHLEALKEVLEEAYAHARGRVIDIKVPGSKVLDGTWFTDRKGSS